MASGRKNRGSRHRSHRHKQQKADDSGDSDADQNLRHGPMPEPNRNPNTSPPWAMEPLPPNVEGPSLLQQPDADNADRKGSQSASAKRRKETFGDADSEMDRWDGGAADETLTLAALEVSRSNLVMASDGKENKIEVDWRESRGKGKATHSTGNSKGSTEYVDASPRDSSGIRSSRDCSTTSRSSLRRDFETDRSNDGNQLELPKISLEASSKARFYKSSSKEHDYDYENPSPPLSSIATEQDKKRRKNELVQKPKKSEDTSKSTVSASQDEEQPNAVERGLELPIREITRNIELEKELENRVRRRQESSKDRDRWRDSGKDRDKGSRFHNEPYQIEDKVKLEKAKDDSGGKADRERSSSRHGDEIWKSGRHLEDKHREESVKLDAARDGSFNDDRDREQRKKSDRIREDRSFEGKQKDEKQKEMLSGKDEFLDRRYQEELYKDGKERDGRLPEGRQKDSKLKENRYKEGKDKEPRNKSQGDIVEEERFKSDSATKREENSNRYKEEKLTEQNQEEDKIKRSRDHFKEDKQKLKERGGKVEAEAEKEQIDKYRDECLPPIKAKHDKKKGDVEQVSVSKARDDSHMVDTKGKYEKRNNEYDYSSKLGKVQNEKEVREINERERYDRQRGSREGNGKDVENVSKDEKCLNDQDGKYRDDWTVTEKDHREKSKDDVDRHNKRKDGSKERRWSSGPHEERVKDGKEMYDIQRNMKEMDERQKLDFVDTKQRMERSRNDRKHSDKIKEEKLEEMYATKDGGREVDLEKGRDHAHGNKQSKEFLMEQSELKGTPESAEVRETKGYNSNKGERSGSKDQRAASSQDQDKVFAVASSAKEANTSENRSKRSRESDTLDVLISDRDHSRSRVRPNDEGSDIPHEKSSRRNKFEATMSVSSSSGTRRPREQNWHMIDHAEQGKQYLGFDEEVRSWEPRGSNQDSDDERRRPFSHDRARDSRHSLSPRGTHSRGQEEFGKSSESMVSKDLTPHKRKQHFQQGAGSTKNRRVDDGERERPLQGTQSMGRSMSQNRQGSSALLPPPPPYRPGVDNPAVMGAPNSFGDDCNPRDSGRYDRKAGNGHLRRSDMGGPGDTWGNFGMGNWNAHNQGPVPGPGNMFSSFPYGMGQQFHMPQMFGPGVGRPSGDMGYGGARFHMADGGSPFPGPGPNHGPMMGWPRFPDGTENHRPVSGFMDSWDGPGRYPDERQRFVHPDWDQFSQGIPRGWEGVQEPWQGQAGDAKYDINPPHPHRESLYEGRNRDDGSQSDTCLDKIQELDNPMEDMPHETPSTDCAEKTDLKFNRRLKERLQMMLVHANISAKLVDVDLYNEYLNMLPSSEKEVASLDDQLDESVAFTDEDLEFEVDSEAQELLSNVDPFVTVLPSLSHNICKEILNVYQRPLQQKCLQKSLLGSFILPESISKLSMPDMGISSPRRDTIGGQECVSNSPEGQFSAGGMDVVETKEDTEILQDADFANAVNSGECYQGSPPLMDNLGQEEKEQSVFEGDNNELGNHLERTENPDNKITPFCNENTGETEVASPLVDSKVLDEVEPSSASEGLDYTANHLEAAQMLERANSEECLLDETDAEENVSAPMSENLGRDFEAAKTIEITDVKGKHRHQESPEIAHKNTH